MIERSERIGELVEILAGLGYEPFVYDHEHGSFHDYVGRRLSTSSS